MTLEELRNKYDELDNIISSLNSLMDDLTDKNYIEQLELIKYEAQNELDEIEPQIQKLEEEEEREINREWGRRSCRR